MENDDAAPPRETEEAPTPKTDEAHPKECHFQNFLESLLRQGGRAAGRWAWRLLLLVEHPSHFLRLRRAGSSFGTCLELAGRAGLFPAAPSAHVVTDFEFWAGQMMRIVPRGGFASEKRIPREQQVVQALAACNKLFAVRREQVRSTCTTSLEPLEPAMMKNCHRLLPQRHTCTPTRPSGMGEQAIVKEASHVWSISKTDFLRELGARAGDPTNRLQTDEVFAHEPTPHMGIALQWILGHFERLGHLEFERWTYFANYQHSVYHRIWVMARFTGRSTRLYFAICDHFQWEW